jgi:hypothetical protein
METPENAPPEAPITPPDEGNYEDVRGGETTPPSGAPAAAEDDDEDAGD